MNCPKFISSAVFDLDIKSDKDLMCCKEFIQNSIANLKFTHSDTLSMVVIASTVIFRGEGS